MAIIQDTYLNAPVKAFPGMIANGETSNRISRTVENAEGLAFGAAAFRGSGDNGCTASLSGATAARFLGWAIAHSGIQPLPGGVAADIYPRYESAGLLTQGAIFINVTGAVNDGDAITIGIGAAAADGYGATAADATHIASGWIADETVTDGLCRVVRR